MTISKKVEELYVGGGTCAEIAHELSLSRQHVSRLVGLLPRGIMTSWDVYVARTDLHLSQQAFAERIGVGIMTVSRWERGLARPSAVVEKRIRALVDGGMRSLHDRRVPVA